MTEQIKAHFTEVCNCLPPLHAPSLPAYHQEEDSTKELQPWDVKKHFSQLRSTMATPSDGLHIRLIQEFAVELSIPLTHIYNKSLQKGLLSSIW